MQQAVNEIRLYGLNERRDRIDARYSMSIHARFFTMKHRDGSMMHMNGVNASEMKLEYSPELEDAVFYGEGIEKDHNLTPEQVKEKIYKIEP